MSKAVPSISWVYRDLGIVYRAVRVDNTNSDVLGMSKVVPGTSSERLLDVGHVLPGISWDCLTHYKMPWNLIRIRTMGYPQLSQPIMVYLGLLRSERELILLCLRTYQVKF